jgi:hypothetical protein
MITVILFKKSHLNRGWGKKGWYIGKSGYRKWIYRISDTSYVIISDRSISDISIAKNGHIGLDISEI